VISDGRRLYFVGYSSLFMLSPERQARRDERARDRLASAAGAGSARAKRKLAHRLAVRERVRKRKLARRVAARRAKVHRVLQMRRRHQEVCYRSHGKQVCRIPRPLVCVKGRDGRTTCRPRRR
jgi:hypothetical protein